MFTPFIFLTVSSKNSIFTYLSSIKRFLCGMARFFNNPHTDFWTLFLFTSNFRTPSLGVFIVSRPERKIRMEIKVYEKQPVLTGMQAKLALALTISLQSYNQLNFWVVPFGAQA